MLRQVHDALRGCPTALPSYATAVDQARATLAVEPALLALTSLLNIARVATRCWAFADHPTMRWHGEHHLAIIRQASGTSAGANVPDREWRGRP